VEHLPLWAVYAIPSLILLLAFVADALIVRNRPSQAGYADFATGDEGDGDTKGTLEPSPREPEGGYREPVPGVRPDGEPTFLEIAKSAFGHPVIRWLTVAEFCTGIVRQGLLLYFPEFLAEVHGVKPGTSLFFVASTGITVGGVLGSLLAGVLSDKVFQSRRPPVALIFYVLQMLFLVVLGFSRGPLVASLLIGTTCTWIFGVHGMLSGTASQDFGGKKAAATAAGLLDGVQYLGSGLTGVGLGALLDRYHWGIWPFCLVPFSLAGLFIMAKLWNAKPGAHAH
jgi:OPA family glycerol-3-phosphate transporter-like MFS transporter